MHETAIVFRREFKSYFLSPIAYIFAVVFLVVGGWLFFRAVFLEGTYMEARMDSYFRDLPMYFLLLAPALTMRSWSEERKLGTLELLLTFPAKSSQLILGKFFAALSFLSLLLLLTLTYPITLASYADLDWGPVIGGYVGAFFLAGAYIAVGLFFSSISKDQIISLIVTFVVLFIFYAMGRMDFVAFLPEFLARPLSALSLQNAFNSVAKGVVDSRDMVYYLSFTGFFLFLNSLVLQYRKWKG